MYSLPQEIEVWYIIPAIRKELAKVLTKDYEMSYEKVSSCLGITKSAISQYLSNKRANKIILSKETKREIKKSAGVISKNYRASLIEIQRILNFMKSNKSSCQVCKQYNKGVVDYCNADPMY